jgi:hypothetical protein
MGAKRQDPDLKSSLRNSPENKSPGSVGSHALQNPFDVAYQFNVSLGNRTSLRVEYHSRNRASRKNRDLALLTVGVNREEGNEKRGKKPTGDYPISFHGRPPKSVSGDYIE